MKNVIVFAFLALFSSAVFSSDWTITEKVEGTGKFIATPVSANAKTAATVSNPPTFTFIEFSCPTASIDFTKVKKVEMLGIKSTSTFMNVQMSRLEVIIANVGGDSFSVLDEVATAMRNNDKLFPANSAINAIVGGKSCGIMTTN